MYEDKIQNKVCNMYKKIGPNFNEIERICVILNYWVLKIRKKSNFEISQNYSVILDLCSRSSNQIFVVIVELLVLFN